MVGELVGRTVGVGPVGTRCLEASIRLPSQVALEEASFASGNFEKGPSVSINLKNRLYVTSHYVYFINMFQFLIVCINSLL